MNYPASYTVQRHSISLQACVHVMPLPVTVSWLMPLVMCSFPHMYLCIYSMRFNSNLCLYYQTVPTVLQCILLIPIDC